MQFWLAIVAVCSVCAPARAWSAAGHEIVAELAEHFVSPATQIEAARLLEPGQRLADVANWADEYRTRCRATSPWHYVNIPIQAARYEPSRDCADAKGGCVVRAIANARAILGDPKQSAEDRGLALRLLVHFVADLHQPLHSGDRNDRGGNDLGVRFAGRTSNLHRVWDHDLIAWTRRSVQSYVDMLVRSLGPGEQRRFQRGGVIAWAEEAQRVARRAYAKVPKPGANRLRTTLGDEYASAMLGALDEQLLRAGVRLAHTLDTTFARPAPPAGDAVLQAMRRCSTP